MVPGMTERERLAADAGRLAWLADARLGQLRPRAGPVVPSGSRHSLPLAFWGRCTAAALNLRRRAGQAWPRLASPLSNRATLWLID